MLGRFALALLLLTARTAVAQQVLGGLRGTVTDSIGAALPGSRVTLLGTAFAAVTDSQGRYVITRVPAGAYTVRVELAAAVTDRPGVRVSPGVTVPLDIVFGAPAPRASDSPLAAPTLTGDALGRLPVDDVRQALGLAPGVVFRGNNVGLSSAGELSIRGSPLGDVAVYVDGAPTRFETFGAQGLWIGTNALSEATLTAGVPGVLAADTRGGVINYVTRTGGPTLAGSFRVHSDAPFGDGVSVGFNRFDGAMGGPFNPISHLSWFVSGTLQGQRSQYRGWGAADQATYVLSGTDTTVQSATLPRFVQVSGSCDVGGTDLAHNYGIACQGLERPFDWSTLKRGQGRLLYSYGSGSSVSLTALGSDLEQRLFPGQDIGDPSLYQGGRAWSRLAVLNWSHALRSAEGGALTLSANLSVGTDRLISGLLDPSSEAATRDPALGLEFGTLRFVGTDSIPLPVTDRIIRNIRSNSGLRAALLNRTDLRNSQPYRFNPYGLQTGWPTQGSDGTLTAVAERRLNGRAALQWSRGPHDAVIGVDATRTNVSFYTSGLITQIGMDAFLEHPGRTGLFASDRVTVGAATIDVGVRYDRLAPGGEFSTVPGRIFTDPAWSPNAATSDTAYATSLARVFTPGRSRSVLSPRIRLAYTIVPAVTVRAGFVRQVEPPTYRQLFGGTNNDLAFTNIGAAFGRDVDYVASTLLELGGHADLGGGAMVDVGAYRKTNVAPYGYRFQSFDDPSNPGRTLNIISLETLSDHVDGLDLSLGVRAREVVDADLAYSVIRTNRGSGIGVRTATTQQVAAVAGLHAPQSWPWAGDLRAFLAFRLTSGTSYDPALSPGFGAVIPTTALELFGDSHLPWTRTLDLQLTKGLRVGRYQWTVFADVRNLLNFRNRTGAYFATGADTNPLFRATLLSPEFAGLASEASAQPSSKLRSDGSIDLGDCTQWSGSATATINCVALQRVERRFGDGDRLFTVAEQTRAFNAYFDAFFGPALFHAPARTLRLGLELRF
jgi:hypothetical protein